MPKCHLLQPQQRQLRQRGTKIQPLILMQLSFKHAIAKRNFLKNRIFWLNKNNNPHNNKNNNNYQSKIIIYNNTINNKIKLIFLVRVIGKTIIYFKKCINFNNVWNTTINVN